MSKSDQAKAREHRLALKLRENLKRRKVQVRARDASDDRPPQVPGPESSGPTPEENKS
jgi:hypothetical protein